METSILGLTYFIIGFIIGFFFRIVFDSLRHHVKTRVEIMTKGEGRMAIATIVVIIWCVTIIAEIVNSSYKVNPLIHGIMGTVVGYFFLIKDGDNGKNKK